MCSDFSLKTRSTAVLRSFELLKQTLIFRGSTCRDEAPPLKSPCCWALLDVGAEDNMLALRWWLFERERCVCIGEEEHRGGCVMFVGEEEQTERHDFPLFRPPGNTGSWCQQHRQTTFSSPREHTDLGVVPRRASARIICVVSAAHDVLQVGILCGSATPNTGRSACRLLGGAVSIPPQGICQ